MSFEELFYKIQKIVNEYDPMHLIKCGAPEDEYLPEVGQIFEYKRLNQNIQKELFIENIKLIFVESFSANYEIDEDQFNEMAIKIMNV